MPGLLPPPPQGNQSLDLETMYQQWAQANPQIDAQSAQQAFMAGADAILQAGGGTDDVAPDVTPDVNSQLPDDTTTDTANGMLDPSNNWRNFKIDVSDVNLGTT